MKIALCTPFKPLEHPSVSGDVTIARDLRQTLVELGVEMVTLPFFPAKEIYFKPTRWTGAARALNSMVEEAQGVDAWLTFGSYYKVPDVFGPSGARRLGVPYCIFQASYAENRRKKLATLPGYLLNRRAMLRADHVFCNRTNDLAGCAKLLPADRYSHIRPGLPEGLLGRNEAEGARLRQAWETGSARVIVTAAMMRDGVKAKGLEWVFRSCAELIERRRDIYLVVAGDGPRKRELEAKARSLLGRRVRFLGLVERAELASVFSAADLFAFPGLKESVGMVYLEAQQCGLPVVATDDEGAPQVVAHDHTGIITETTHQAFTKGMDTLVRDLALCTSLGNQAPAYVAEYHSARRNYGLVVDVMQKLSNKRASQ
ncbi:MULTISPECIES: glycosyltransferase family 4 protein [unclassified Pseudodesulfovibrio]|uniref:glycosyltransferase family 4 protein n=1 Tax=unclassified Pseudodesulfovibrio TaxID=2661612 RepID=UPI000FEB7B3E|nr:MULTISPECIES: glycosyltransferase family 4 protein [unclassified Pseudodesulfovibrio]MCJ2165149.1 glycosyltransferase family 4 protein [Pseudodesulfovibrio sp. S3-i]RWU03399.1 glycosyltransferase [Pseudodesulfovibrio sp. S3]